MLRNVNPYLPPDDGSHAKRRRRPTGTPDPDAEVVSLSPARLLESNQYVCEICSQGFRRDQNLQMHRRCHKVPWKLLKSEAPARAGRKRAFVCPEPTCLHHDPAHALGDLVGIKKHFRRKHSSSRQWVCQRCSKGYAVQSDYKAHLKTCGTRGHACDCGRVFSRVESFIEHQDACSDGWRLRQDPPRAADCLLPAPAELNIFSESTAAAKSNSRSPNLEFQLLTNAAAGCSMSGTLMKIDGGDGLTQLQLSVGCETVDVHRTITFSRCSSAAATATVRLMNEQAREHLQIAVAEKASAEETRQRAKRQIDLAEQEFFDARKLRQQAQADLAKAEALKQMDTEMVVITCHCCKSTSSPIEPSIENKL